MVMQEAVTLPAQGPRLVRSQYCPPIARRIEVFLAIGCLSREMGLAAAVLKTEGLRK